MITGVLLMLRNDVEHHVKRRHNASKFTANMD